MTTVHVTTVAGVTAFAVMLSDTEMSDLTTEWAEPVPAIDTAAFALVAAGSANAAVKNINAPNSTTFRRRLGMELLTFTWDFSFGTLRGYSFNQSNADGLPHYARQAKSRPALSGANWGLLWFN